MEPPEGEKHALTKLNQEFTYWFTFFKKGKDKQLQEFEDNLKEIGSFSTAEEFWGIYQHMKRPDALPRGSEFFLFKKGIRPLWEDPSNANGGRLYVSLKKSPITNKVWEDLQIALLLADSALPEVNGVVLNVRTCEVILSIWTRELSEERQQALRAWIRESLDLPNEQFIEYKKHPKNEELLKKQEQLVKEEEERIKKQAELEKKKEMKVEKEKEKEKEGKAEEKEKAEVKEKEKVEDEASPEEYNNEVM